MLAAVAWPVLLPAGWLYPLFAVLAAWIYYRLSRYYNPQAEIRKTVVFSFLFFSTLLSSLVALRVAARVSSFSVRQEAMPSAPSEKTFLTVVITGFPEGYYDSWMVPAAMVGEAGHAAGGDSAGGVKLLLRLPAASYDDPRLPLVGDLVRLEASYRSYRPPKHPFLAFRAYQWMASDRRVFVRVDDWSGSAVIAERSTGSWLRPVDRLRRWIYGKVASRAAPEHVMGIVQAMLLGTRDKLTPEIKDLFLDLGAYHLFAISGLHVGIVVAFLFAVSCQLFNRLFPCLFVAGPRKVAAGIALLSCWFYVLITGMHLPAVRAGIMASVFLLSIMVDAADDPFSSLLAAVIIILALWPQALFQLSFQLSVAAVAAILLALTVYYRTAAGWLTLAADKGGWGTWLSAGTTWTALILVIGLAAWLATGPLLLNRVHFLTPFSLVSSLILVPVFSCLILPLGFVTLLLLPLPLLGTACLGLLTMVTGIMINGCQWVHSLLPGLRWYAASFTAVELILYYAFWLIVGMLCCRRKKVVPLLLLALLMFVMMVDGIVWYDRRFQRDHIAISAFVGGFSQAMIVEMPTGEVLLVNGGSFANQDFSMVESIIAPFCWSRKIGHIDVLILTNPQRGAVAGLDFMIEHFGVREIWYNGLWTGYPPFRDFYARSKEKGVRWRKLTDFSRAWIFNRVTLKAVAPPANDIQLLAPWRTFLDEMALSMTIQFGDCQALIWGGSPTGLQRYGVPEGQGQLDLLFCIQSQPASVPMDAQAPMVVVLPSVFAGGNVDKWPKGSLVWQTRSDGFIECHLFADGKIRINKKTSFSQVSPSRHTPAAR